jgi:hemerythrin-like domain-containing protein
MKRSDELSRRRFVTIAGTAGAGVVFMGYSAAGTGATSAGDGREERKVTPAEDLMFEHGVIERLLLIYGEAARRIDDDRQVPGRLIFEAAGIIRSFAEDYHEKLEEQFVFPPLEKAGRHADLAQTLQTQHVAGREVTTALLDMTKGGTLAQPRRAAQAMRSFYRMYIPHISRENSVVFRAFHDLMPPDQYAELGEQFEEKEHSLFGEDGFRKTVERVAVLEKELGVYDLSQFTPKG